MIWLIIYLTGCVASLLFFIWFIREVHEELTFRDLFMGIIMVGCSWITISVSLFILFQDKVLWRKK